jgi:hypothetical protein
LYLRCHSVDMFLKLVTETQKMVIDLEDCIQRFNFNSQIHNWMSLIIAASISILLSERLFNYCWVPARPFQTRLWLLFYYWSTYHFIKNFVKSFSLKLKWFRKLWIFSFFKSRQVRNDWWFHNFVQNVG